MQDNFEDQLERIEEEVRINSKVWSETNEKLKDMIEQINIDLEKQIFQEIKERE